MSDPKAIKETLDDFFNNCGKADDAHAKILLQMILLEALRPSNKNNNRFWIPCCEGKKE